MIDPTNYNEEHDADLISNRIGCPSCKITLTQARNNQTLVCNCKWFAEYVLEEYDDDFLWNDENEDYWL